MRRASLRLTFDLAVSSLTGVNVEQMAVLLIRHVFGALVILASMILIGSYFMLQQSRSNMRIMKVVEIIRSRTHAPTAVPTMHHPMERSAKAVIVIEAPAGDGADGQDRVKVETAEKVENENEAIQVQVKAQATEANHDEDDQEIMARLTPRYWTLVRGNASSNETFFTAERLADYPKYNLLRPRAGAGAGLSVFKDDDRIIAQLVLGMEGLPASYVPNNTEYKRIVLVDGFPAWYYTGSGNLTEECPEFKLNSCRLVEGGPKKSIEIHETDAVISNSLAWRHVFRTPELIRSKYKVPLKSKLLYYALESPYAFPIHLEKSNDWLNTYWRESDIVTPYGKWLYFDKNVTTKKQDVDYAALKANYTEGRGGRASRRFVAIFTSNCHPHNERLTLAYNLKKYVPVDVYGMCGSGDMICPRHLEPTCFQMLQKSYKFYLAFENSNCRDYITEKFFHNALANNVVPVVLGATSDDLKTLAPEGSYIHVEDFKSVQDLASYLLYLDGNDEAYNSYFAWKGTGDFLHTKYFCRTCAMLHYSDYIDSLQQQQKQEPTSAIGIDWNSQNLCTSETHLIMS